MAIGLLLLSGGGYGHAQTTAPEAAAPAATEVAATAEPVTDTGASVVVSASRIDRAGFKAPTPTTVIGGAAIAQRAAVNVADVLNEIPAFRATNSATSGTTSTGVSFTDLRGLGSNRTLVERAKVANAVISVIESLSGKRKWWWSKQKKESALAGVGIGRQLRDRRILSSGEWQGSFDVPVGSVVLAVSLGTQYDELATEIMVRIMREQKIDARSLALEDLDMDTPPEASPELVSIVCVVSVDPLNEKELMERAIVRMREALPHCKQFAVLLPSPFENPDMRTFNFPHADHVSHSFDDALQTCLRSMQGRAKLS